MNLISMHNVVPKKILPNLSKLFKRKLSKRTKTTISNSSSLKSYRHYHRPNKMKTFFHYKQKIQFPFSNNVDSKRMKMGISPVGPITHEGNVSPPEYPMLNKLTEHYCKFETMLKDQQSCPTRFKEICLIRIEPKPIFTQRHLRSKSVQCEKPNFVDKGTDPSCITIRKTTKAAQENDYHVNKQSEQLYTCNCNILSLNSTSSNLSSSSAGIKIVPLTQSTSEDGHVKRIVQMLEDDVLRSSSSCSDFSIESLNDDRKKQYTSSESSFEDSNNFNIISTKIFPIGEFKRENNLNNSTWTHKKKRSFRKKSDSSDSKKTHTERVLRSPATMYSTHGSTSQQRWSDIRRRNRSLDTSVEDAVSNVSDDMFFEEWTENVRLRQIKLYDNQNNVYDCWTETLDRAKSDVLREEYHEKQIDDFPRQIQDKNSLKASETDLNLYQNVLQIYSEQERGNPYNSEESQKGGHLARIREYIQHPTSRNSNNMRRKSTSTNTRFENPEKNVRSNVESSEDDYLEKTTTTKRTEEKIITVDKTIEKVYRRDLNSANRKKEFQSRDNNSASDRQYKNIPIHISNSHVNDINEIRQPQTIVLHSIQLSDNQNGCTNGSANKSTSIKKLKQRSAARNKIGANGRDDLFPSNIYLSDNELENYLGSSCSQPSDQRRYRSSYYRAHSAGPAISKFNVV